VSAVTAKASPARLVMRRVGDVSRVYRGVIGRTYFPLWLGQLTSALATRCTTSPSWFWFPVHRQGFGGGCSGRRRGRARAGTGSYRGRDHRSFSRKSVLIGADLFRAILALSLL
jgi:hypothetical protein